jgi:conjugal transfer mating pair stabilization protein TraN
VSISRTSSCSPGEWFAQSSSGSTSIAIQCRPDQPPSAQRMRVTSGGVPVAFFDVDANSALVFPRRVADLPTPAWPAGGPNGVWIVNNQCSGDNCHLTGFIAQEHRQICTGGGGDSDAVCTTERPFHEVYAACPAGTQSGNNIAYTVDSGGDSGSSQTFYLDQATCYAPTPRPSTLFGTDLTGTVAGYYWTTHSSRPVVGFRLNPLYGPIPQMALSFERPHTTVTESDQWDDQCPALASDGRCAITGAARCADGPGTKEVDGAQVTRACWRYETSLSCQFGSPTDECAPLAASGCTPSGTVCRQMNAATGVCEVTENTYTCPVASASAVTARNCPTDVFCVAGSCFNTTYTSRRGLRALDVLPRGRT